MTRRQIVKSVGTGATVAALRGIGGAVASVKALLFDVFGTVVDWRGSIIEEGRAWGTAKGITVDWARFADQWRAGYMPAMDRVRKGQLPRTNLDQLNRALLEKLIEKFHTKGLSEDEKDHWNRVWHRLKPWPDSIAGLTRLKKKYTIAPLSNGNVALLTNMAKHAGLPWDLILSAELARHYKPDREAYLTAASLLELKTRRSHDVRGALPRSDSRAQLRSAHRIHPPGRRIRTWGQGGSCQAGRFRRGVHWHGGSGIEARRVTV